MKPVGAGSQANIELWGVKQNNLKNIAVQFPLGSFTVVCGPSGSGKSSLAFATLFAEGQRRYIESISSYARQFLNKAPKPDLEGIKNIPPAIAIEQKNSVKTSRSTVGTTTEISDYLRLLFEKLGVAYCPTHHQACESDSVSRATDKVLDQFAGQRGYILAPVSASHRVAAGADLLEAMRRQGILRIYLAAREGETYREQVRRVASQHQRQATTKKAPGKKSQSQSQSQSKTSKRTSAKQGKKNLSLAREGAVAAPSVFLASSDGAIGEWIELSTVSSGEQPLPASDFFVVVDRLAFATEERGRLADSIAQAYATSLAFNHGMNDGRAQVLTTDGKLILLSEEVSCPVCGFSSPSITAKLFSFNSPLGACPTCKGFGNCLELDEAKVVPNAQASLSQGALHPFTMPSSARERREMLAFAKKAGIDVHRPWQNLPERERRLLWAGGEGFWGVKGLFDYLETKKYKMHVRVFLSRYKSAVTCPDCQGSRLKPEASLVRVAGHTINELSSMTLEQLLYWVERLPLSDHQRELAGEVLKQLLSRLRFLNDVGVNYLSLNRETRTLSGGEYQRLNLANQLGMGLSQTLYVLDEPTVGLHPRDNDRLIRLLQQLNQLGNTLVVVEHDIDVIKSSHHIIEMGPGSGHLGGQVLYAGATADFYKQNQSMTAPYLLPQPHAVPLTPARPIDAKNHRYWLALRGASGHNLKNLNLDIPLNRLVTVTGVSGSGKSTLISQTLYPAVARALNKEFLRGQPLAELSGTEHLKNVMYVDQSPIGKSARSSPVTYLKIFEAIRAVFAAVPEAKERGYSAGTFSLNVPGGRCPGCEGLGLEVVDMAFMDDVEMICDVCDGKKYIPDVLEVRYKGLNIYEVLSLTVQEAMDFFVAHPNIRKPLLFLKEVGLDYLPLGQSATSLSGGESQRLKIARESLASDSRGTLYILDEPTTGLHFREVEMLLRVLAKLIEGGGSVILVEHNMDVIRNSDFVVDLGPEAGEAGGQIVFSGTPHELLSSAGHTGRFLRQYATNESHYDSKFEKDLARAKTL